MRAADRTRNRGTGSRLPKRRSESFAGCTSWSRRRRPLRCTRFPSRTVRTPHLPSRTIDWFRSHRGCRSCRCNSRSDTSPHCRRKPRHRRPAPPRSCGMPRPPFRMSPYRSSDSDQLCRNSRSGKSWGRRRRRPARCIPDPQGIPGIRRRPRRRCRASTANIGHWSSNRYTRLRRKSTRPRCTTAPPHTLRMRCRPSHMPSSIGRRSARIASGGSIHWGMRTACIRRRRCRYSFVPPHN